MRFSIRLVLLISLFMIELQTRVLADEKPTLNADVLKAVEYLDKNYGNLGYGLSALTHDITFGNNGILKAQKPPLTMCVAAQYEVLAQALQLYYEESSDDSPFHFIPKISWERLRPLDLRGQIWQVSNSPSHGAADAFTNYGIGERISFKDLQPGSFLNFNRTNGSGHAVIFLGFLDKDGNDLKKYSDQVGGFWYFSSNGRPNAPGGGLAYRWAFFSDVPCPTLSDGRKRDCGVMRKEKDNFLVGGVLWSPTVWDQSKAASQLSQLRDATDPAMLTEGVFRDNYFTGVGTDD